MMLLMLLQTSAMWGNLASGFLLTIQTPCFIPGSGGDRAASAFSGILFVTNLAFALLAFMWKGDWLDSRGSNTGAEYSSLPTRDEFSPYDSRSQQTSTAPLKETFIGDEDAEGGL